MQVPAVGFKSFLVNANPERRKRRHVENKTEKQRLIADDYTLENEVRLSGLQSKGGFILTLRIRVKVRILRYTPGNFHLASPFNPYLYTEL